MAKHRTQSVSLNYRNLVSNAIKEKYLLLFLGTLVVLTMFITGYFILIKSKPLATNKKSANPVSQKISPSAETKKYIVKKGDYLWKIAEEAYGSGYNAYDIAKANNIADPSVINAGQILTLPMVAAKTPTKGEITVASATTQDITISADNYIIKSGDNLWDIALHAYGDGYAWTRIAKANNLTNPDLIHVNNKLVIPR